MQKNIRKSHGDTFKFKVALEALKGNKTVAELSQEYAIASAQIYAWKKQLEDNGSNIFGDKRKNDFSEKDIEKLHAIIGKQKVEIDFLAKVLGN